MQETEQLSILPQLEATHAAAPAVRRLSGSQKAEILNRLAALLLEHSSQIQTENQKDLERMPQSDPKWDRLLLNDQRIQGLAQSVRDIAQLPDPSGQVLLERTLPNGLDLKKIAVPLGVVGVIYESRPNVTIDVTAICLRSGNAVVLRGGSDAWFTNQYLVTLIHQVLQEFDVPAAVITLLPTNRELMKELLTATRYVDIIIPRGSSALIQFVRQHSLIPTIETGAGVVHTYVQEEADLEKARDIVVNARVSRPSVCNSLDCILVDQGVASAFLPMLCADFEKWNVEVFADPAAYYVLEKTGYPFLRHAQPEDFGKEWLDYKITIKVVTGLDEALEHIRVYSSRHSEAIISENPHVCQRFLEEVDAAAVYANASTRFTDGGEFGLGAEIGISTQKLHARGPFALEKLLTEKWVIQGDGQVRW
ncbi:glutamate-5-semialdehyde dehydrogenase [Siphonobacter sp. SORGH_AS_0500]|uniref:glutamate-5-semialdehyde dehydrogenase n=1 Tax=Siphonobacter sp. SORGH_AS_0500 TaxID=1864824 RepID=UPI000CB3F780|nr:glutamate-5-semialdehyde dehydrogenase [Siphonobacter sp. SORGH_AS_0500]PKK37383.1 glutamate-5-semialdehyde dehydrogenase [Siphonobacter sp. SORGH_AS_0500]